VRPDEAWTLLKRAFGGPAPPRPEDAPRASGVLVPLVDVDGRAHVLLTRRSEALASHPGELSFPGGRAERGESALEAALRETEEEVGVAPSDVEVAGHLTDYLTYRGVHVTAYVGRLARERLPRDPRSPAEVAEVLLVPVHGLLDAPPSVAVKPERRVPVAPPRSPGPRVYGVGAYEARALPRRGRIPVADEADLDHDRVVHYWRLAPATTLWGISGEITARFLARGYGWRPRGPVARIRTVEDFVP